MKNLIVILSLISVIASAQDTTKYEIECSYLDTTLEVIYKTGNSPGYRFELINLNKYNSRTELFIADLDFIKEEFILYLEKAKTEYYVLSSKYKNRDNVKLITIETNRIYYPIVLFEKNDDYLISDDSDLNLSYVKLKGKESMMLCTNLLKCGDESHMGAFLVFNNVNEIQQMIDILKEE